MNKEKEGDFIEMEEDLDYRSKLQEVMDYCRRSIHIVAFDLSCINYPEIFSSMKKTRKEGIPISVYFYQAPKAIVETLKNSDIELYKGGVKSIEHEYIVEDEGKVIQTEKKGKYRSGFWTTDESQVDEWLAYFHELTRRSDTTRISKMTGKIIKEREVEPPNISEQEIEDVVIRREKLAREIGKAAKPDRMRSYKKFVIESNSKQPTEA